METLIIKIEYRENTWEKTIEFDPKIEDILEILEEEQEGWSDMMLDEDPNFNVEFDEYYETYNISYTQ